MIEHSSGQNSFLAMCAAETSIGWDAYHNHPWLVDLENGRLSVQKFLAFQVDDAPFIPYIHRALAMGLVKAASGSPWSRTASNLIATYFVKDETDFKHDLVTSLCPGDVRFDSGALTPAREGYANHLLATAFDGTAGEIAAALYPCAMFTQVVGERFRDVDGPPAFTAWTQYYANKAGSEMAQAHGDLMNAEATTDEARERMLRAYARSLQHQIRVFDAAYEAYPGWPQSGWAPADLHASSPGPVASAGGR